MDWLRNLGILQRLLAAFAFVAVLLGSVGMGSLLQMRELADSASRVHRQDVLPMETLAAISRQFLSARIEVRDAVFHAQMQRPADAAARNRQAAEHLKTVERLSAEYEKKIKSDAERELYARFRDHLATFGKIAGKVTSLSGAGQPAQAVETILTLCTETADKVSGTIDAMMKLKQDTAAAHNVALTARTRAAVIGQAIALLVGLILSIGLAVWISRSISTPVSILADAADRVAIGRLDADIRLARRDELGRLAAAFNTAIGNTRALVQKVNAAAQTTEHSGLRLAQESGQLASSLSAQAAQSDATAHSLSGIAATMDASAKRAAEAAGEASQACADARASGAVVLATVSGMNEIAQVVNDSERSVAALGASSERIGNIVAVIEGIATQTGLLALNAAIEAARAGEQGRGFAVVADEVRLLSQRTQQATREVSETVTLIQSGTAQAVKAMQHGSARVEAEKRAANAAVLAIESIIERTQRIDQVISAIGESSTEQVRLGEAASANIIGIGRDSRLSAEATRQLADTAEALTASTGELKQLLAGFKVA
jgi:methyl-accepting chemotaxis protein